MIGSLPASAWDWLWRGRALRAARDSAADRALTSRLRARARIAAELAEYALHPAGPWLAGDATHLAAALFAESIGWSLRMAASSASGVLPEAGSRPAERDELVSLISDQRALLLSAARDPGLLERVSTHLLERDYQTASGNSSDVKRAAGELGLVAVRLLVLADADQATVDTLVFQRTSRVLGAIILVLAAGWALRFAHSAWEARSDLTLGKPWRTSSNYDSVCQSPHHECGQTKTYFFHTSEEASPWFEIDLQSIQQFSRVRVKNRKDCCAERALPLVIEVSTDHQNWREVMRRDQVFEEWNAHFRPTSARWVRLRIARKSILHLNDVQVLQ